MVFMGNVFMGVQLEADDPRLFCLSSSSLKQSFLDFGYVVTFICEGQW